MEDSEESLDEPNMLRSELTTKDSLVEEQRKENEVNVWNYVATSFVAMYVCT